MKGNGPGTIAASDSSLRTYSLHCEGATCLLFTENETNNERLFGTVNPTPYVKDGINDYVVAGRLGAVNQSSTGTEAAAHSQVREMPEQVQSSDYG
jgi:hypothetical protein